MGGLQMKININTAVTIAVSFFAISGCSQSIATMTCADVAAEAVTISEGELVKITGGTESRRSDTELVCHGTGVYARGGEVRTRYRAYIDADGDFMIAYDVEEAATAEANRIEREIERENAALQREMERDMREFEREMDRIARGY